MRTIALFAALALCIYGTQDPAGAWALLAVLGRALKQTICIG